MSAYVSHGRLGMHREKDGLPACAAGWRLGSGGCQVFDCELCAMNFTLLASLISAAVAGALGVGAGLHWRESEINQLRLDHANERIAIQRQSRATLERHQAAVSAAQSDAQLRAVALRRAADSAASELDRVRESIATAMRAARDSHDACLAKADACGVVFAQCADRLVSVAADTDQCLSDNKALTDGWPK